MSIHKKFISLIVLGAVLAGGLIFYFRQNNQTASPEQKQTVLDDKEWQFAITKDAALAAKKYGDLNYNAPGSDYLLWKQDGYLVYLPTNDSFSAAYCGLPDDVNNGETEKIYNLTPLGRLNEEIKNVFIGQGYLPDNPNSTKLGDYYFSQGYYKDKVQCSLSLSGDISACGPDNQAHSASLNLKCADSHDGSLAEQKQYVDRLMALNAIQNKNVAISEIKKAGQFLGLGVTDGIEGALFIIKQEQGRFVLVDGPLQEDPSCQKMSAWQVPQEIYGSCYDADVP